MKRIVICFLLVAGICVSVPVTAHAEPVNAGAASVTIIAMPKPKPTKSEKLVSVSCVSTDFCVAVGMQNVLANNSFSATYIDQTLIKMWDGITWSVSQSPNIGTMVLNQLFQVSCVSRTFCKASGTYRHTSNVGISDANYPLIVTWNGASWSLDTVPDISLGLGLSGLSCPSISSCFAVGSTKGTRNPTVLSKGVFMQWDGMSWAIQKSPQDSLEQANYPGAISCVSTTFCMAVGKLTTTSTSTVPAVESLLIQTWDGLNWSTAPAPNVNASEKSSLNSVSCVSSTYCMAVGTSGAATATSATQTLALLWDGVSWTLSQSPNTAVDRSNSLRGVVCVSVGNCLAVGSGAFGLVTSIGNYPLMIRWDGNNWTVVASAGLGNVDSGTYLFGQSCISIEWCMAVGYGGNQDLYPSTLSVLIRPAKASLVSTAKKTLVGSKLTKNAGIVVPKGAKVALAVSKKHKKICSVVGSTVKTVRKGTCLVSVVVTTKTGQKTSGTTSIKVR